MAVKKKDEIEERVTYNERAFLDPEDGLSAIQGKIKLLESKDNIDIEALLILGDRDHQIDIDFGVLSGNDEDKLIDDRRTKVGVFRTTINAFLDAMESAYDEMQDK